MQRSTVILAVLTLAFAAPAHAQQTVDQQTRQQVEAIVASYVDGINKGDGQAVAALYAANPISITPSGKRTSSAQVQSEVEAVHKRGLTLTSKVDQVEPLSGGQVIAATAPYQGTFGNDPGTPNVQGNFVFVLERSGDSWKVRIFAVSRAAPAPAR